MIIYEENLIFNGPRDGKYILYILIHEKGYYSININGVIEAMLQENIDKNVKKQVGDTISSIRQTLAGPTSYTF